jgi:hypothetical protein
MYVMITLNTHTRNLRPLLFTLAAAHSFLNSNEVTENEVLRAVGWETDTIKTMCYVMWCYHIQLAHIILGEKWLQLGWQILCTKNCSLWQCLAEVRKMWHRCCDKSSWEVAMITARCNRAWWTTWWQTLKWVRSGLKFTRRSITRPRSCGQPHRYVFFCLLEQSQFKWLPGWDELFTLHIMCVWADLIHGSWRHFCPRTMLCRRIRSNPSAGSYQSQVHWGW